MLIQACLNGSRAPGEHPALPITPEELAQAAADAVASGAGALHIHPRDAGGAQSLAAQDVGAALAAIRARCPGVPLGVTTAAWIEPEFERRLTLIYEWNELPALPDYASVNFNEDGALDVCNALLAHGVGIEAGLGTLDDVELLRTSGIATRCLRLLIEMEDDPADLALQLAEQMIQALDAANIKTPRLLHGYEESTWAVLAAALRYGYDTRIGLEDTLCLPNGRQARDNAELIAAARTLAQQAGRISS
jgi:uncharacterized protein (DUF849 family)